MTGGRMDNPDDKQPIADLVSLAGRTAVVTGAGQGIGAAVAARYAEAGARVLVADLDGGNATRVADGIAGAATGHEVDVAQESSVDALARAATDVTGRLDVWANFAAVYPIRAEQFADVLDFTTEEWNRTLAVNLTGSFLCSRAAARAMVDAGNGGVIINTTTTVVDRYPGHPGMLAYASSKAGIEALTRMLAGELGPRGIRAFALKPTIVRTEGIIEHLESLSTLGDGDEDPFAELEQLLPVRRFGVPDDVARVALFAASDMARFMTGCTLPTDGGEHLV